MIYGQDKKKSPRNAALILDWIHIVIGFLVVLFAVIAFLNPEDNRILFPLIFLLAAGIEPGQWSLPVPAEWKR